MSCAVGTGVRVGRVVGLVEEPVVLDRGGQHQRARAVGDDGQPAGLDAVALQAGACEEVGLDRAERDPPDGGGGDLDAGVVIEELDRLGGLADRLDAVLERRRAVAGADVDDLDAVDVVVLVGDVDGAQGLNRMGRREVGSRPVIGVREQSAIGAQRARARLGEDRGPSLG